MSYFDSPKNRAMWKKEMAKLRSEREIRKSGGLKQPEVQQEDTAQDTVKREPTNLRELMREECTERHTKKKDNKRDNLRIMDKSEKGMQVLLGFLLCFLLLGMSVQAGLLKEISLAASDPENGYRYEWDHYGGFYTNVLQGGNAGFAVFSIDDTLDYRMLKDGEAYAYLQEDLLVENGSYTLCLFVKNGETQENCATFDFQIVSEAFSSAGDGGQTAAGGMLFPQIGVQEREMTWLYDREQGLMRFRTGDTELLTANIPNGAMISTPVYLKAADGVTQTIYRNGKYFMRPEDDIYEEAGFYRCVQTLYPDIANSAAEDNYIIMTEFYFWIIDNQKTCVNVVGAPEGFYLEQVFYQGTKREIPQSGHYFLQGEGSYRFCFTSAQDGGLSYTLELNKDTTAPFLDFDQEIENGKATAPLTITCKEPSCSYEVVRNGMKYDYVQGKPLTAAGYYEVVVSDAYGNSRKYTFLLEAAYHFFSPGMILLLSSLAAVLLIVLYRSGHNLTVI